MIPQQAARRHRNTLEGRRRRAMFLINLLATLMLAVVVSYTAMVIVTTALRSQILVGQRVSEYATMNDLMDSLRSDVRRASNMTVSDSDGKQTVTLTGPALDVLYVLDEHEIVRRDRSTASARQNRGGEWRLAFATVEVSGERDVLNLSLRWGGVSKKEVDPSREWNLSMWVGRGYTK